MFLERQRWILCLSFLVASGKWKILNHWQLDCSFDILSWLLTTNKGNIKALHRSPWWEESNGHHGFPHKGPVMWKSLYRVMTSSWTVCLNGHSQTNGLLCPQIPVTLVQWNHAGPFLVHIVLDLGDFLWKNAKSLQDLGQYREQGWAYLISQKPRATKTVFLASRCWLSSSKWCIICFEKKCKNPYKSGN